MASSIRVRVQGGIETYWRALPGYSQKFLDLEEFEKQKIKNKFLKPHDSTASQLQEAKRGERYGKDAEETILALEHCKKIDSVYQGIKAENLIRKKQDMYFVLVD